MTSATLSRATGAVRRRTSAGATDAGFSLVELLVAMTLTLVVMGGFFGLFFALSGAGTNVRVATSLQETTRNVVRVLEADVRSADPLVLVPPTFTSDPNGTSNSGTNGTSPTDVIALFEVNDRYSPCKTSNTTPPVPSPFEVQPVAANIVWAFDPVAGTLTRYSYCASGGWTAGVSLANVVNASATMFSVAQDSSTQRTQQTAPTSTIIPNQSTPVCGTSMAIVVSVKPPKQANSFAVRASVPLENQNFVQVQEAC